LVLGGKGGFFSLLNFILQRKEMLPSPCKYAPELVTNSQILKNLNKGSAAQPVAPTQRVDHRQKKHLRWSWGCANALELLLRQRQERSYLLLSS
jgi:hypothetical protein